MRKRREAKHPARPATSWLPEVDASYRDDVDPDPLVEAMVERLRSSLSGLVALDDYGRPVAWRAVVRVALGPTLSQLRDAETSLALLQHGHQSVAGQAGQAGHAGQASQRSDGQATPVHVRNQPDEPPLVESPPAPVDPLSAPASSLPAPDDRPPQPDDSRPSPSALAPPSATGWP